MLTNVVLIAALCGSPQPADAPLQQELRSKDQALLDAFAPGDRAVWDAALDPAAVYLDENNVTMTRGEFLEQLKPLPAGTSGHIDIVSYRMVRSGDIADVIHQDAETEDYHGQTLHTIFIASETWHRTPAGWRILMVHMVSVLKDPPALELPGPTLAGYAGTYGAGPDLTYVITLKDGLLTGNRPGRPPVILQAEAKDLFFVSGQPRTRKLFQRDRLGSVTGFVDRREGTDVVWKKLSR